MATGINTQKAQSLKVSLLDSIESLKTLSNRIDVCYQTLASNIEGDGKDPMLSKLDSIRAQMPIVISNVDSYITDINKVGIKYQEQDEEQASQIIADIEKI